MNEIKEKDSGEVIKHESFETYWSGVDQSKQGCRDVGFILSEILSEYVNDYGCDYNGMKIPQTATSRNWDTLKIIPLQRRMRRECLMRFIAKRDRKEKIFACPAARSQSFFHAITLHRNCPVGKILRVPPGHHHSVDHPRRARRSCAHLVPVTASAAALLLLIFNTLSWGSENL
ncbi:hypothetical protein EVAR_68664_1 [Eumeta japonica]|uniref:Uncharacterized protein n=1 Tax=Eumeta variegata TaxID=151549 RepID=A0A4C1ZXM7_EUMVA|nr:hypothetical protein EVAR_68664_1 [Eumeta japonica]